MSAPDFELLKLAAQAAKLDFHIDHLDGCPKLIVDGSVWNPLCFDAQALRLAVILCIHLGLEDTVASAWPAGQMFRAWATESHGNDPFAATRRAIVRAAAAMASIRRRPTSLAYDGGAA
ncbi:hypothetical protein [Herbaspirillum sp. NPDC101397]|uniref:hypothetical protein n=1 Tax=Herbaspirillum sp. NPDC101397 TaxID=3364006 RepID=UPI00383B6B3C